MSELCLVIPDYADWEDPPASRRDIPCYTPATETVTIGCVHEHIDSFAACERCAAELRDSGADILCMLCQHSSDPHECPAEVVSIERTSLL